MISKKYRFYQLFYQNFLDIQEFSSKTSFLFSDKFHQKHFCKTASTFLLWHTHFVELIKNMISSKTQNDNIQH